MGASRLLKSGAKKRKTDLPLNGAIQWKPVTLNQNAGAEVLRRLNIDGGAWKEAGSSEFSEFK